MICEITRRLEGEELEKIQSLEQDLGLTLVAFSCRSLDPAREERLRQILKEFGPRLQAEPADPDEAQLASIRALEDELGLALIAVHATTM